MPVMRLARAYFTLASWPNVGDDVANALAIEPPGHQACGRVAGKQVLGKGGRRRTEMLGSNRYVCMELAAC